jgi:recombination protein RecA
MMENNFEELDTLLEDIQNAHKKLKNPSNWTMGNADGLDLEKIPLGLPALDRMLHGGIPKKRMTLLTGKPSCGKSYLATKACAQVQREGGLVGWIDAELSWEPEWARTCGLDPSRVMLSQPFSGEEAMEVLAEWLDGVKLSSDGKQRTKPVDIIVLDSLAALSPAKVQEDDWEKSPMAWQSRFINSSFPRFFNKIQNGSAFIAINQERTSIGGYKPLPPGGLAQQFFAHLMLEVRKGDWLPSSNSKAGEREGFNMVVRMNKTKVGGLVDDQASVPFTYNAGVREYEAIIDEALYSGILTTTSNGRYEYKGNNFHGRINLMKGFQEDEELYEALKQEIEAYASTI